VDARNEQLQSQVLELAEQIRQGTERETRLQASLHARDTELINLQTALGTLHAEVRRRPPCQRGARQVHRLSARQRGNSGGGEGEDAARGGSHGGAAGSGAARQCGTAQRAGAIQGTHGEGTSATVFARMLLRAVWGARLTARSPNNCRPRRRRVRRRQRRRRARARTRAIVWQSRRGACVWRWSSICSRCNASTASLA
jgi:hypothetical protein